MGGKRRNWRHHRHYRLCRGLIIDQTAEVHREIADLLAELRQPLPDLLDELSQPQPAVAEKRKPEGKTPPATLAAKQADLIRATPGPLNQPKGPLAVKFRRALDSATQIEFVETPADNVVDYLSDLHKIPLKVSENLEKTIVTINIKDVTLGAGLQAIEDKYPSLEFVVRDYGILLTEREVAKQQGYYSAVEFANADDGFCRTNRDAAGSSCSGRWRHRCRRPRCSSCPSRPACPSCRSPNLRDKPSGTKLEKTEKKGSKLKGTLALMQGNKARLEMSGEVGRPAVGDADGLGRDPHALDRRRPRRTTPRHAQAIRRDDPGHGERRGFFALVLAHGVEAGPKPQGFNVDRQFGVSEFWLGMKEFDRQESQVIEYKLTTKAWKGPFSVRVWLDPKTNFPLKRLVTGEQDGQWMMVTGDLCHDDSRRERR